MELIHALTYLSIGWLMIGLPNTFALVNQNLGDIEGRLLGKKKSNFTKDQICGGTFSSGLQPAAKVDMCQNAYDEYANINTGNRDTKSGASISYSCVNRYVSFQVVSSNDKETKMYFCPMSQYTYQNQHATIEDFYISSGDEEDTVFMFKAASGKNRVKAFAKVGPLPKTLKM